MPQQPIGPESSNAVTGTRVIAGRQSEIRPLGSFEFLWLIDQNRPVHFALAAQVQGPATVKRWRNSLDLVQRRHPFLSVCIETNGNSRPHFHQKSALIPLRLVKADNAVQRWESEMELELSVPFDARRSPLVRAALLHETNQAVIILAAHHSIADGRSIAFVIRDLLQVLSGNPIDLLPVLPAHEELLGITSSHAVRAEPNKESNTIPPGKIANYLRKEDSRPHIRGLRLTHELTGRLRGRARQQGTTVHGALSSALVLAYRQTTPELRKEPVRICSPIDTRKLLGLGEDCAVLVDAGMVTIEPSLGPNAFWDLARQSMRGLAGAQTLKGVFASKNALHQTVKNGIDVPTAAGICAQAYAHEIMLTNIGNLPYGTDFGELKLEAVWGPAFSARFEGATTVGVATTNGALCLLETSFASPGSLLKATEQILVSASAAESLNRIRFLPLVLSRTLAGKKEETIMRSIPKVEKRFSRQSAILRPEQGKTTDTISTMPIFDAERWEAGESLNRAHAPRSDDLHRALIEAPQKIEFDCAEPRGWEPIKAWITQISLGLLLLAALVGFAIVCWEFIGCIYKAFLP